MTDLAQYGIDPSHRAESSKSAVITGLVYCMRCCRLLFSEGRGVAKSGPILCPGPVRLRPLEPVYDNPEPIKES